MRDNIRIVSAIVFFIYFIALALARTNTRLIQNYIKTHSQKNLLFRILLFTTYCDKQFM